MGCKYTHQNTISELFSKSSLRVRITCEMCRKVTLGI